MIAIQGRFVTFAPPPEAAYLMGDFTDWDEEPLSVHGPMTLEFPEGAYVEYAYLDADKKPLADPTNPVRPRNPWHDYHRCLVLPQNRYRAPPQPQVFHGRVREHIIDSRVFGQHRMYAVYEPVATPLATLSVQDGEAFYRKLHLHRVAEALIEQEQIRPVRLAMLEPAERLSEYWFNERCERFLGKRE